ncbi:glycerophosphodiester phosphodiesterase [Hymenobacter sp. B81]|uniref:glycerophosphodiester phosphodiesterase n=1 Tax=Hymenobacter sp. B81 TaxID=3344878 RepID=UPI0037DC5807
MSRRLGAVLLGLGLLSGCARSAGPGAAAGRPAPLIIGHAGSGFLTPFNRFNPLPPSSLGGVTQALAHGADGVEVDVQLSQDSVLMLFHDPWLQGITPAQGCVSQFAAAELARLPYRGGWPYDWFQHERVAPLETLLARLSQHPAAYPVLHLDLHEADYCAPAGQTYARSPALVRALGRLLRRYPVPAGRLLVLTEHIPSLPRLAQELPGVPLGLEITGAVDERLATAPQLPVAAVVLPKTLATPARVAQAQAAGLQVVLFGGRSRGTITRLLACRPNALQTDHVPRARRLSRHLAAPARPLEATLHAPNREGTR